MARPADSGETRAFEDLVSQDRGRDPAAAEHEPAEPAFERQTAETAEAEDRGDARRDEDEDDEREDRPAPDSTLIAALATPSLLQTLLNAPVAPAPVATSPVSAAPAENADSLAAGANTVGPGEKAVGTRPTNATTQPLAAAPQQGERAARAPQAQDPATSPVSGPQPGATTPGRRAETAPATPETAAVQSRLASTTSESAEASAQPAVTRLVNTRARGEKSAAPAALVSEAQTAPGQNKAVLVDHQQPNLNARESGTRSAIPAATMSSSTTSTAQRLPEGTVQMTGSPIAAGWTGTLSVDWKGWTNGGGERTSTAAQFSQLGEKLSPSILAATPGAAPVARTAVPAPQTAAPAASAMPVEVSEALAPIHSAIERLVLHGREQLALTVRFEQGGSLSIKLAMNHGEIATQIQTDVPGLEAALKSAWGELAQDWNGRGWKLGNPEITSSTPAYHHRDDATADGRQGQRQARRQDDDVPEFGGRAFGPARLKHGRPAVTLGGLDALRAAALARRGIHTWA